MKKLILALSLTVSATCFAAPLDLTVPKKSCTDMGRSMKLAQACISSPKVTDAPEAASTFKTVVVCTNGTSSMMVFSDGGATPTTGYAQHRAMIPDTVTYFTSSFGIIVSSIAKPGEESTATFLVRHQPANYKSTYTCVHE